MVVALCQAPEVARRSDSHHTVYMPQPCAPHPHSSHLLAGFASGGQQAWRNMTPPISYQVCICLYLSHFVLHVFVCSKDLCFRVPSLWERREGMNVVAGFSLVG